MQHTKKFFILIGIICLLGCLILSNCTSIPSIPSDMSLSIPYAGDSGGFEIIPDTIRCSTAVNNGKKYACFESFANNETIELYADKTEVILTRRIGNTTQFYKETFSDNGQPYVNPLQRVYDELRQLNFQYIRTDTQKRTTYYVYEATQTIQTVQQEQIDYQAYSIELDWLDGNHYSFKYYNYSDGALLISAEAPDEINPLLQEDTKWVVDLENECIYNRETSQKIPFIVSEIVAGKGLSPNDSNATVTEEPSIIWVSVNAKTKQLEKLQYVRDEAGREITILQSPSIASPKLTENMTEMDEETFQMATMLLSLVESFI